jgi:polysaccharide pyruvyl transferase WcaK-like protein
MAGNGRGMAKSAIPRILLDTGDYRCGNLGDVAMLQVAVSRLKELWPNAVVHVLTEDADALARHCPSATPLPRMGRDEWFSEKNLLGTLHDLIPRVVSNRLVRGKKVIRRRWPTGLELMLLVRAGMRGASSEEVRSFLDVASGADLVALSGAGGMTDHTKIWSMGYLNLFEMASQQGTPAAMLGHGFGRITDRELLAAARRILPQLDLVCLREKRNGQPLLASLGVNPSKCRVTGDDAIEPAYQARAAVPGQAIGINVRIAPHAGIDRSILDGLRPVLFRFAEAHGASIVGLPITVQPSRCDDSASIRELLGEHAESMSSLSAINTPKEVMREVSKCRIVVTGAYHAAVFALSQGIPAVCLAASEYVRTKFQGLAVEFGGGLHIVDPTVADFPSRLAAQMQDTWETAPSQQPQLLRSATRQISDSRRAYSELKQIVASRRLTA